MPNTKSSRLGGVNEARCRGHLPGGVGVRETPARVVRGADGDGGVIAHEERPLARGGRDLELRPTELLHLEGVMGRPARSDDLQLRRAEVHGRRQLQREVEAAEAAHRACALRDLVPARVLERVRDLLQPCGLGHVTRPAQADAPHPSLDPHLVPGPIHLPIVGYVEPQLVAPGLLLPALTPPGRVVREDRDVVAPARDEHGLRGVRQAKGGEAVRRRLDESPAGQEAKGDISQGTSVGERGRPSHEVAIVHESVEADLRGLHPGSNRRPVPTHRHAVVAALLGHDRIHA